MTEPTDEQIEARDRLTLFLVEFTLRPLYEGNEDEKGNKNVLLTALKACLELRNHPMPRWVAEASRQSLDDFLQSRVRTLDEAFTDPDIPVEKHQNLNAKRKKNEIKPHIVGFIRELQADGCSLEKCFEAAAKKWNVSTSAARDTYYYPQLKLEQRLAQYSIDIDPYLEEMEPFFSAYLWPNKNK